MAFIQSTSVGIGKAVAPAHATKVCKLGVKMAAGGPSRRAILRSAVSAAGLAGLLAVARSVRAGEAMDLQELKKDVEELNYEDELVDAGPDDNAENPTRAKKKVVEPEYVAEEKELIEEEEESYEKMLAKEAEDAARVKARFSKK